MSRCLASGLLAFTLVLSTAPALARSFGQAPSGPHAIRVKASGRMVALDGDRLASTRANRADVFDFERQGDGTYRIWHGAEARGVYLHADDGGDHIVSVRYQPWDDFTRFYLEPQGDGSYRIRVKATGLYLHADDNGDLLLSTRYQPNDDFTRFYLEPAGRRRHHEGGWSGRGTSAGPGAVVYQHCGYGGYGVSLAPGAYRLADLQRMGIRNDDLSSVRVPAGTRVELYEHDGFAGRSWSFSGDDDCFTRWNGLNDVVSSIVVTRTGSLPHADPAPAPQVLNLPVDAVPQVPMGLKLSCMQGPDSPRVHGSSATCPVIRWGRYTYWAFSFTDNRFSMVVAKFDERGHLVRTFERAGARYVWSAQVDPSVHSVRFWGQANRQIEVPWSEL